MRREKTVLNTYCLPTSDYLKQNISNWQFDSSEQSFERSVSDLNTAKYLILISAFVAIIISFLYIHFISYLGRFLVWLSIIATFIGANPLFPSLSFSPLPCFVCLQAVVFWVFS